MVGSGMRSPDHRARRRKGQGTGGASRLASIRERTVSSAAQVRCGGAPPASPSRHPVHPEVPSMPFIIAEPCIGVKDKSCVEVCPVNCIYEGEDQFYIHPDECIDCQACEAACPVQAIFPDNGIPEKWSSFTAKNRAFFQK
jgi:NAD-dependent dihydropyrimidine dehydrogenase PreA subunit